MALEDLFYHSSFHLQGRIAVCYRWREVAHDPGGSWEQNL